MQRWASALFGLCVLSAVAIVVWKPSPRPVFPPTGAPSASNSAQPARSVAPAAIEPPPEPSSGPEEAQSDGPVPALPDGAPKSVDIGVIQFAYRGAERAPSNAPPKEVALEKATKLVAAATKDFDAAVPQGDPGSTGDLGRIPRGVLEPRVEYAVFTLEPGGITQEPLDTPRGYWIVRRSR